MLLKISKSNLYIFTLYLIFINEWFSNMPLLNVQYTSIKKVVLAFITVLFVCNMLVSRYKAVELVICIPVFALSLYSYYSSSVIWMFYLTFFIVFIRNINISNLLIKIEKIMQFIWWSNIFIFLAKYIFFYETLQIVTSRNMLRYDLNFLSPSVATKFWVVYMMVQYLVNKGKILNIRLLEYSLITILVFYFTGSEACFLVFVLWIFGYFKNRRSVNKMINFMSKWSFIGFTIFSLADLKLYSTVLFRKLDIIFTGRLGLEVNTFSQYGFTIFGQIVELPRWILDKNGTYSFICLDNTIASLFINYGAIYLLPVILLFFLSNDKLEYIEKLVMLVYSVMFFMQDGMLSPFFTMPFLIAAYRLLKKESLGEQNEEQKAGCT